jgi:hypothetical protein
MWYRLFLITMFALLIMPASTWAQAPEVEWELLLGNPEANDYGLGAYQTDDGGYIVGANCNAWDGGYYDVVLFKLNADGDTLWSAAEGGDDSQEVADQFHLMPDGSYMFVGNSDQDSISGYAYVYNANPDGSYGWTGLYGEVDPPEFGISICPSDYWGYMLVTNYVYTGYSWDMKLYTLDEYGWVTGSLPYHISVAEFPSCIRQMSNDHHVITGRTQALDYSSDEMMLVVTNEHGEEYVWARIGETYDQAGVWVDETDDGGFIVTGWTNEVDGIGKDVYIVKTNEIGYLEWEKIYGFRGHDVGKYVIQTTDGGYVVGATCGPDTSFDFWLLRLDASGDTLWTKIITRPDDQSLASVDITDDGGYLLCGNSGRIGNDYSIYVVKLGPDPAGIDEDNRNLPTRTRLYQNYPNPFNAQTNIRYALAEPGQVKLEIYDIMGRKITELVDEYQGAGYRNVIWHTDGIASGVYFCRLTTESDINVGRMALLK